MEILYHDEVKPFIKSLQKPTQSKVLRSIGLLGLYGQNLGMPHVQKIISHMSELRIRGQQEIRIFFTIHEGKTYLLHGFIKKTQKTPQREIETAEKRLLLLT